MKGTLNIRSGNGHFLYLKRDTYQRRKGALMRMEQEHLFQRKRAILVRKGHFLSFDTAIYKRSKEAFMRRKWTFIIKKTGNIGKEKGYLIERKRGVRFKIKRALIRAQKGHSLEGEGEFLTKEKGHLSK